MSALGLLVGVLVAVAVAARLPSACHQAAALARVAPLLHHDVETSERGAGTGPRRRRPTLDPVTGLPDVIDLLAVAVAAGLPVLPAVVAVAPRSPEPWRSALGSCLDAADSGELLGDALGALPAALGDTARPLVAVLRAGLADGDGVPTALARLTADARDLRRRQAEERARRVPIRLLLPLVACSLPAFAVLTIVPILAGALDGLQLPT